MTGKTLNKLIEDFELLPLEDKEYAIEVGKNSFLKQNEKLSPRGPMKRCLT